MKVIVGGIIKKDNKYLLVKEAKEKYYGLYNIPAGHLEDNELLIEGAKREIKEETGYDVILTHLIQIGNTKKMVSLIFLVKIVSTQGIYHENEILSVEWMTYDEIIKSKAKLRAPELIIEAIESVEKNKLYSLDLIKY